MIKKILTVKNLFVQPKLFILTPFLTAKFFTKPVPGLVQITVSRRSLDWGSKGS